MRTVILVLCTAASILVGAEPKKTLTVRAIAHVSRANPVTSTSSTPASSSTDCSQTLSGVHCQTTPDPVGSRSTTSTNYTLDVVNAVEANGLLYTISCRANWQLSNCTTMIDGDTFSAELQGTTM